MWVSIGRLDTLTRTFTYTHGLPAGLHGLHALHKLRIGIAAPLCQLQVRRTSYRVEYRIERMPEIDISLPPPSPKTLNRCLHARTNAL